MTQHFVETNFQPHLIVLSNQYHCEDNQLKPYFDKILLNLEKNFTEQQNFSWEKYWKQQGEAIILEKWKDKYGDYLADESLTENNEFLIQESIDNNNQINFSEETKSEEEDAFTLQTQTEEIISWQELWQQHSEEIYYEQFVLFSSIFYNFYLDLKTKLQNETNEIELEVAVDSAVSADDLEVNGLDVELLQLLGLPTKFGGRQRSARRKKRCSYIDDNCEHLAHYNDWFSDDDNNDDESDVEYINDLESIAMSASSKNDEASLHELETRSIIKAKNKKKQKNRKLRNIPAAILEDKVMLKYWHKRFSLFSRFDEGIRLDQESWFSVTPEKVALHLAERLACDVLIDGFCGCGGNAIQFAKTCRHVIAIDIDPLKIEMAKHNAKVYGVAERIEFIVADFFHVAERLRGDVVFLSPPWGGPKYKNKKEYDIENFLLPVGASVLVDSARRISENVALFLPRNSNMQQIVRLAGIGKRCEVEHNYLDTRLVAITALYGEEILRKSDEVKAEKNI